MQKSVVQVWLNDVCSKQITVTPSSTCEDIIKYVADQYNIPKRATRFLELHVVHNGKGKQPPSNGFAHTDNNTHKITPLCKEKKRY